MNIYTDGACTENNIKDSKNRRGGIGVYIPSIDLRISEKLPDQYGPATNNRAELWAIIRAFQEAHILLASQEVNTLTPPSILIKTDSQVCGYVLKDILTNNIKNLKKKENQDLVQILYNLLSTPLIPTWSYEVIPRYTKNKIPDDIAGNQMADALAGLGSEK